MQQVTSLRPPAPGPAPWLVIPHGKTSKDQTFYSILEPEKNYLRRIPEFRRKFCWASDHGWMVMSDDEDSADDHYFLWNPVSLETIQLPPLSLKTREQSYKCTLSSPPSNPDCMVLFFGTRIRVILFCRPRDQQWTKRDYDEETEKDIIRGAVGFKGKIYALTFTWTRLVVIDAVKPDHLSIRLLEAKKPKLPPNTRTLKQYLMESCGELFVVYKIFLFLSCNEISTIEAFRMDFYQLQWVKAENLDDRVFFLGENGSMSCYATELRVRGGCTYFTFPRDKSLYKFNQEDGAVSVSLPCPNLPTPWFSPTWVMPNLRQEDVHPKIEEEENDEKEMEDMKDEGQEGLVRVTAVVKERNWFDLPWDILTLIAGRLLLVDYMYFRSTCRTCRLVAPPIQWRTASVGLEMESLSPWLMFLKKEDGNCNFIDPKHNDTYLMNISELFGATIRFSKGGWLLMSQGDHSMFFFNPFTRSKIQLPDLHRECYIFSGISFSSLPTSSDCVVFCISEMIAYFICKGDEDWNHFYIDYKIFMPYANNPVFYNEAFYCLGEEGKVGVFDLRNEFSWTVLAKPEKPCTSIYHYYLAECDGELLSVFVGYMGNFVEVFRLNCSMMAWIKVKSLGNHMLFISHSSSISAVAKTPEMANKIYFSKFRSDSIVYYSLETGRFHSFGSEHSMMNFYDLREHVYCGWIEPRSEKRSHWLVFMLEKSNNRYKKKTKPDDHIQLTPGGSKVGRQIRNE
ncbi:hypothetical protein HHK36_003269 [Tetracentron sinense]|uniref:KIB1-4 beta-propeller domain-containing protein n=1 Tax=Tetracentron sinense TaxID=13715 RepID=A0A835DSA7_TETSI|nr:hypothetical protein HHK36_003269 [Tetracentron sinense]